MRKGLFIFLGVSLLCINIGVFAEDLFFPTNFETPIINEQPKSSTPVKVAIGTNNFASYEWDNAEIYSDGEFEVYNNKTYINTFDHEGNVKINMVGKIFVLTDTENNVIAKVSGPIIFKSDFGKIGIRNLKRAGKDAIYRGKLTLVSSPHIGKFQIINELEVEDYLKGVVPNEMPVYFGLEALKAQSVAARNYVLSPRIKLNSNYDVVDSVASQVYFGANTENPISNKAVTETKGIVALYNWDLIIAQYSSTAGGYTESYENAFSDPLTKAFPAKPKPYLVATPDIDGIGPLNTEEAARDFYLNSPKTFDIKSSYYRWEREWTAEELQNVLQTNLAVQSTTGFVHPTVSKGESIGNILALNIKKRGLSGKIMDLEIVTNTNNYLVQKELVIRRLLTKDGKALPSANLVFEYTYNDEGILEKIKAYGGGFGHGVGMSQYGAGYMGQQLHKSYDEILKHYYKGISLGTKPVTITTGQKTQNFYSQSGCANLVIDNKNKSNQINVIINSIEENFKLDTTTRYSKIDISKYLSSGENSITYKPNLKGVTAYVELN